MLASLTAGMAALADDLFYQHPVGWSAAWFVAALGVLLLVRYPALLRGRTARVLLVALAGLAWGMVLEPTVLNGLLAGVGVGLLVLLARCGRGSAWQGQLRRWRRLLLTMAMGWWHDLRRHVRWSRAHPPCGDSFRLRLWVLPLGLSMVFVGLFLLANPVLVQWCTSLWDNGYTALVYLTDWLHLDRMVLWALVASAVWGLLRYRTPRLPRVGPAHGSPAELLQVPLVVRCLLAFNAAFALQTGTDLAYLWGGAALPPGLTYAQYAHRGAYPLVITALLAGVFVLVAFRPGGAAQRSIWARRLVALWIGQNVLLLISTLWRVVLYVRVYSLTYWRLASLVWIALVALGFLWLIWRIAAVRSHAWLLGMNALTLACVLYVGSFFNAAGFIAEFNLRHCREVDGTGVPLDVKYLESLGPDALPALARSTAYLSPAQRQHAVEACARLRDDLEKHLSDWRGWTLRRHLLARRLHTAEPAASPAMASLAERN